MTFEALLDRATALIGTGGRRILGITGPPGAGKSTLAARLVSALGPDRAAVAPMDGFHLADAVLRSSGRRDRKGAPDTFDRAGYAAALRRLRPADQTVYLPRFDRAREDSVAAAIAIAPSVALVVTEGNYLLLWPEVAALLDQSWYLDGADEERVERLVRRRLAAGADLDDAQRWAWGSDRRNAEVVAATRADADVIVGSGWFAGR